MSQVHVLKFIHVFTVLWLFCYVFIDNGPHYHNSGFLLYLAEVNAAFNLHLIEYNNFEAGEGKSKLDTHFAHISHKIVRWVRVGNNLESGSQLGELIGVCKLLFFNVVFTRFFFLKQVKLEVEFISRLKLKCGWLCWERRCFLP